LGQPDAGRNAAVLKAAFHGKSLPCSWAGVCAGYCWRWNC